MTAPYGAWASPITAETVISAAVGLNEVRVDRLDGGAVWWSEGRPEEGGRVQIVREGADVLPDGYAARTRVHEYGGGAWAVHDGVLFFANWADQRLYRLDPGSTEPVAITPEPETPMGDRYADMDVASGGSWLVCVREHHPADGGEAVNEIVRIDTAGSADIEVLWRQRDALFSPPLPPYDERPGTPAYTQNVAEWLRNSDRNADADPGLADAFTQWDQRPHDFVSNPRVDRDHTMAWLQWVHPAMPWDAAECAEAGLDEPDDVDRKDGSVAALVADHRLGGGKDGYLVGGVTDRFGSICQPSFSPDGTLHVIAERDGWPWWNLYALTRDGARHLAPIEAEVGVPQWVFGQSRYDFLEHGRIVCAYRAGGRDRIGIMSVDGSSIDECDVPFTSIDSVVSDGHRVVFIGASPTSEPAIVRFDPRFDCATGEHEILRAPRDLGLDPAWISVPEAIEFPTTSGPDGEARTAHALYYPPTNPEASAPAGERPPLLVLSHGGPTAATRPMLSLGTQFWTSRGFAVVDVDYGGSTGYGREYRDRLRGAWGIVDVQDCVAAARFLADRGDADPDRLCIRGGSAGGYTTLQALTTTDVFAAGASHYGVADLGALARETHKFESRYLDGLVGPWPEAEALYRERSPIEHTDGLSSPMIILQGSEDEVVPPDQAEMMVAALEAKGLPYAYVLFEGEQHGFRKAENIVAALESELSFYGQVFGFEPAGDIQPVTVVNLP